MGSIRVIFLSSFLCFLVSNVLTKSVLPVDDNKVEDHEYGDSTVLYKNIAESVNDFADYINKYLVRERPEENVFTSPVGVYLSLLMLHYGAGDNTRKELDEVLKLSDKHIEYGKLYETFSEIVRKIEQKSSNGKPDEMPEVIFANVFLAAQEERYSYNQQYIKMFRSFFNVYFKNVDFYQHAEEGKEWINSWINERTKNRFGKFYDHPLYSNYTVVLPSAMYFHGIWKYPFNKDYTKVEKFHTGETEYDVPMMRNTRMIKYTYSDKYQFEAIRIPYKGEEYVMNIYLPRPTQTLKNLTQYEHWIDYPELTRNEKVVGVEYKIPNMKFYFKNSLIHALGHEDVFRYADLSRIMTQGADGGSTVSVSDVYQAIEMRVNESGTVPLVDTDSVNTTPRYHESSSVTVEKQFYVNRPFYVNIMHVPTHMTIFQGTVYEPQQ